MCSEDRAPDKAVGSMGTTPDVQEKWTGHPLPVLNRRPAAALCPAVPGSAVTPSGRPVAGDGAAAALGRAAPLPPAPSAHMQLPKLLTPELPSVATETLRHPLPGADQLGSKTMPVVPPPLGTPTCCCDLWADTEAASSQIPRCQTNVIPRSVPEPRSDSCRSLLSPPPWPHCTCRVLNSLSDPDCWIDMRSPQREPPVTALLPAPKRRPSQHCWYQLHHCSC